MEAPIFVWAGNGFITRNLVARMETTPQGHTGQQGTSRNMLALCFLLLGCQLYAGALLPDSAKATWADTSRSFEDRTIAIGFMIMYDSTLTPIAAADRVFSPTTVDRGTATYRRQLAFAHCGFGTSFIWHDKYPAAMKELLVADSLFANLHDGWNRAHCELLIGASYLMTGALDKAMLTLQGSLKVLQTYADTVPALTAMENIIYILELQGDLDRASELCKTALAYLGKGHARERPYLYLRLGAIQLRRGDARGALATMDTAQAMLTQGLWVDYRDEIGATTGEALVLLGDCSEGLKRLLRSLERSKGREDRNDMVAFLYARIARAHLCAKQYGLALRAAKEGLVIAEAHHLGSETIDNLQCLSAAYEGLGDLRNALDFTKRYQAMNDSVKGARSATAVTGVLLQAGFERKEFIDSVATARQREQDLLFAEQRIDRERTRRNIFLYAGLGLGAFLLVVVRQRGRIRNALRRSDELLLNILPEEVAEELKEKGRAEAKHFANVTILFTDFKGFTEASERMSPQELVEELNTCFKAFDAIITAHGIEKIKTIGDAYMCVGGLPDPASSTPADVVHAALEMQAFMKSRKTERDVQGKPSFEMRVGIHSGPVVAGIVGVKKFQYDIWGDTVNTASRMESSGEVGKVNVSGATFELVKGETGLIFTPRGKIQAKGKGEMEMYFIGNT